MNSSEEAGGRPGRARMIEEAQTNCHLARSEYLQRKLDGGGAAVAPAFQRAVMDYYWALRPLRGEDPVRDWWDDVTLSELWQRETVVDKRMEKQVDRHTGEQELVAVPVTEERPVVGLESLQEIDGQQTETVTRTKTTMAGTKQVQERRPQVLHPEILVDISGVLDDAAGKLGFNPDVDSIEHTDEVSEEDLEELFESWGSDDSDEVEVEVTDDAQAVGGGD